MPLRKLSNAGNRRTSLVCGNAAASAGDADEVAAAEARAEAARVRAERLRQLAEGADQGAAPPDAGMTHKETTIHSRPRLRRPTRRDLAVTSAILVICASLTASGFVVWHHRHTVEQRQRAAEFASAARNAIVTMMSIDPGKAREEMQRFADDTTGIFKIGFLMGAEDLVKAVEQSKISTKTTVGAVAVQSMTKDSALVLVAARSQMTKPGEAKPSSRLLRAVVSIQRDGGQLKVSRVEFVP